jgi:uncharacterized protein (DUF58 family)
MSDPIPNAVEARLRAVKMAATAAAVAPPGSVPPVIAPRRAIPPPLPGFFKRHEPVVRRRLLLSPAELERFGNLLLFARSTVEGFFAGKHRSPYRGSSVEFSDYKEYVSGDDPKRIDWRAYGRSRRLFVRQYEAETDMVIYLLVDVSASMNYAGSDRETKYVLAAKIAAALSYLMIHQGDKAALGLFAETLKRFLPPGGTRGHLHNLLAELEAVEPMSTTGIALALKECNALFKRRGLLVVLSDFWDDTDRTFEALSRFSHRKFEILLLQIVHPHELDLPGVHAARFHDMETHDEVEVEPEEIRAGYRELARRRSDSLAREANLRQISHALVRTDRPYLDAIEAYLGFRGRNTLSTR